MSPHKLVRDRDQRFNSPRQLDVTARPTETKRICVDCRRVPDRQAYSLRWLAANPLPRRYCAKRCGGRTSFTDSDDHKRWHISANMPKFETLIATAICPDCSGRLESITW